ncbi:hypothetical protein Sjap_005165 [Stephania japonica]|uniref:Uncharacterized protein n=1 Tax=Stephania japonica TaxID=461633 RepID=A0AAP0K5U6_9MAGN
MAREGRRITEMAWDGRRTVEMAQEYIYLTEQELDQWIEQKDQEIEEEMKSILQKITMETVSAIPLKSIEVNVVTSIEDYWNETVDKFEVSSSEPDISIAKVEEENEMKLEVIFVRP